MEKKYRGNFGELTINISANKLTGTYGQEGTIEGSFIDNQFKGTWSNKGQSGLLNFTLNDDKLEGTYKQGLDEGPMKGKWKGSVYEEGSKEVTSPFIEFINDFRDRKFNHVYHFMMDAKKALSKIANSGADDPQEEAWNLYNQLETISSENPSIYAGMLHLFAKLADRQYDLYMEWDNDLDGQVYSFEDLTETDKNIVGIVCENYTEDEFLFVFTTKFIGSLISLSKELDAEDLAEFICSSNSDQYKFDDDTNVWEITESILDGLGYDVINDYEGDCTIYPNYWLRGTYEFATDYILLAEHIRSHYV